MFVRVSVYQGQMLQIPIRLYGYAKSIYALTAKAHGLQGRRDKAGTLLERIERLYSKKITSKYAVNRIGVYTKRACEITHPTQGRVGAIRDDDHSLYTSGA